MRGGRYGHGEGGDGTTFGARRGATKPPVRPIKIGLRAAWAQACGLFPSQGDSAHYLRGVKGPRAGRVSIVVTHKSNSIWQ